jgi:hypothetical protein
MTYSSSPRDEVGQLHPDDSGQVSSRKISSSCKNTLKLLTWNTRGDFLKPGKISVVTNFIKNGEFDVSILTETYSSAGESAIDNDGFSGKTISCGRMTMVLTHNMFSRLAKWSSACDGRVPVASFSINKHGSLFHVHQLLLRLILV